MEPRTAGMTVLVLATLILGATSCWADPPDTYLFGVEVELSTPTAWVQSRGKLVRFALDRKVLKGYAALSAVDAPDGKFDPASPEALDIFKKTGLSFCPAESVFQIGRPVHALVTTLKEERLTLQRENIARVRGWNGKFNGYHAYAQPFFMPKEQLDFIQTQKPVYSCAARYSLVEGAYWMSFNPKIGKEALGPVCEGDYKRPAPTQAITELRSNPGVFIVETPTD